MNSGININELKSDIVNFKDVQKHDVVVPFIDFTTNNVASIQNGSYPTISSNMYSKYIKLKNIDFINNFSIDILMENIENDFFIEAQKLGYKNRKLLNKESEFDIILKNKNGNNRAIVFDKLNTIQLYFSKTTRLGGFGFMASNFSTYMNLRNYLGMPFECVTINDKHTINGIPFIINNSLDDDVVLIGRKNNIDNPGVHCFILTDKNQNIDIDVVEIISFDPYKPNKMYRLYYKIDDIGVVPENQYLIIKTSDLQSTRCKKLNRIKELYGE